MSRDLLIMNKKKPVGRPRRNFSRGRITEQEYNFAFKFVDAMVRDKLRFSVYELQTTMHITTGKIRSEATLIKLVNELLDNPMVGYTPNWFVRTKNKVLNLFN